MAFYPNQLQPYSLAGSGAIIGATSLTLKSMKDIDGNALTMSTDFGAIGYATLEPGNGAFEEQISFTGLTNNSNGTTTLTGIKSVSFDQPYTETSGLLKTHPGSSILVISNTSGYYSQYAAKQNNETITGYWNVPDPVSGGNAANRDWVLSVVNGGDVSQDSVIVVGTAGETVAAGDFVYLKSSDGFWYKTDATTSSEIDFVQIGIAQGAGTATNVITDGVLVKGIDANQTGLVAGTIYYLSDTAGDISTSAGTLSRAIGQAITTTTLLFDPYFKTSVTGKQADALVGAGGTPSTTNKYTVETYFSGMIMDFAGSSIPSGWLDCDGSAVSRTTYANLFSTIGTTWGIGDGSLTFNVPDLRGRAVVGAGTGTKVATFASRSSNVITVTGLTNAANNEFQTGQAVLYSAPSGAMTGLTDNTTYYIVRTGNLTFSLATSLANAQNGTVISLSSDGTGTQTFTATLTARTLGDTGGEENHAMSVSELLSHNHQTNNAATTAWGAGGTQGSTQTNLGYTLSTLQATGGNAAMNNMQPFGIVKKIIKT